MVGISADSVDDHAPFCETEGLSPLLSDPDGTVSKAYGSWMAPIHCAMLIDPDGILRQRWLQSGPVAMPRGSDV